MQMNIAKIIKLADKCCFFVPIYQQKILIAYDFGACGELLCHNLRSEWIYSNVINRKEFVFPIHPHSPSQTWKELADVYIKAKKMNMEKLPLALAWTRFNNNDSGNTVNDYFNPRKSTTMKYMVFVAPSESQHFFHYWQQQRKIWWRKFSANPGKFSLTQIQRSEDGTDFCEIKNEETSLETISNHSPDTLDKLPPDIRKMFEVKSAGKKSVYLPRVITSEMCLENASLCYLRDAYVEEKYPSGNGTRVILKFHRKLAPYKFAFFVQSSGEDSEELKSLARFLAAGLKKVGIATLETFEEENDDDDDNERETFIWNDARGIPYTVVLSSATLTDGLFQLRSRDTTLSEEIHVNNLVNYAQLLLKNY